MTLVRSHYIYLNEYKGGYLYVGSHSWDGPEGQLDPNYTGSSKVAEKYNWSPLHVELLEVVSEERRYSAEREWIEKYAAKFGIADCAALSSHNNSWILRFPKHGKLLNLHSNNAEQATKASLNAESRRLQHATRVAQGTLVSKTAQLMTSEAIAKSVKSHDYHKTMLEVSKTRDYVAISTKAHLAKTINGRSPVRRVRCYKDGTLLYEDSPGRICKLLGHPNWNVTVSRKLSRGLKEFTHYDYLFVKI